MGELVQLRRHYEVIFVQALDLLRLQRDRGVSPAEADVGVVTFSFGEVANTLRKGKRLGKILELEGSLDPSILIAYCPCGSSGGEKLLLRLYRMGRYRHGKACKTCSREDRALPT